MDLPIACVTMVDAREGDAYVVDLRVSNDHTSLASWNRYIVDTGYPIDIFSLRNNDTGEYSGGGGPRASLVRALFEEDITADTHTAINNVIQPWERQKGTPRICGMIITHTDRDHWGNAEWLARYLQWGHTQKGDSFSMNPLPTYTSPMIEWFKDVAAMSKGQVKELTEGIMEDKSVKELAAKSKAKKFLTDEFRIGWQKSEQKGALRLGKNRDVIEEEHVLEDHLFQNPTEWAAAFKKYKELQQTLLKEKPYCSLEVHASRKLKEYMVKKLKELKESGQELTEEARKNIQKTPGAWTLEYFVHWKHKVFTPAVGCSFNNISDMAKALGYLVHYRFNLQNISVDVEEPDVTMLMRPLTDLWIKANTTTSITTWRDRPVFAPTEAQLSAAGIVVGGMHHEVLVIAEVRLVPPPISTKRSYPVGPNDANSTLAGDWLRLMAPCRFVAGGVEKPAVEEDAVAQIKTVLEGNRPKLYWLHQKLTEDENLERLKGIDSKTGQEKDLKTKLLELVVQDWFTEPPAKPGKLVQDVDCLGLQDTVYGLNFVLTPDKDESGKRIYSYWKSTYSGCAGTRFSRDFLHLAAQAYLSPEHTDKWFIKAKSKSEVLEDKSANEDYLYNVELKALILQVLKRTGQNQNSATFVKAETKKALEEYLTKDDGLNSLISEANKKFDANKKDRDAKAAAAKDSKKVVKKNRSWGHAANRASLITHFRFEALTHGDSGGSGTPVKFDMLFTGDAFEIGAGESQPYAPHLRPGHNDFQIPSAVRPRTIEKQPGLFSDPDGNLLSWLWQNGNFKGMRVGVLKLPHHGSSNTTNALFYRLVSASIYLISGSNVPHGHPRPETLQAIINTIMQEDGPARPPSDYCSVESLKRAKDYGGEERVKKLPHISKRLRPRMIFLTNHTCTDKQWIWEEREAEMQNIIGKRAAAREARNKKQKPPSSNPGPATAIPIQKDDPPSGSAAGNDDDEDSSDDDLDHEPQDDDEDGNPGKKTRKRDYMDVKQFVYFHSHHLGGFNDVVESGYEKWKKHSRMKRKLDDYDISEGVPKYEMPPRANVRLFVQKKAGAATRLMFGLDSSVRDQCRVAWDPKEWDEIRADDHSYHDNDYDPFHDPLAYPGWDVMPEWEMMLPQENSPSPSQTPAFGSLVPTSTRPVMPPGHALPMRWADKIMESTNPAQDMAHDHDFVTMNGTLRANGALSKIDEEKKIPLTMDIIDEEDYS